MIDPTISIVVPVFNVEQYLKECLDSILSQSFKSFEVLLIDDGSTDRSGTICDKYANEYSQVRVFHLENRGVSSARNHGIENAKGKWVTFVDSDDVIEKHFLEGLYEPIHRNTNIQFVHGGCKNWEKNVVTGYNQRYSYIESSDALYLLNNFRGLVFSKLFNVNLLNVGTGSQPIRFDCNLKIAEDMAFTFLYIKKVQYYAFVEESGYLYRRDNIHSATHTRFNSNYSQELYCCDTYINNLKEFCAEFNLNDYCSEKRLNQIGDCCFKSLMYLYSEIQEKCNRKEILIKDWTGFRRNYLLHSSSFVKKKTLKILFNQHYLIFDKILSIIVFCYKVYYKI